jgi:hypothetical protein
MKSRKLVLLAGLLVAFLTGAEANDNQIVIGGTVKPAAVVGFDDVSALQVENDGSNVGRFYNPKDEYNLGTIKPNEAFGAFSKPLYVKTNTTGSVTIKITADTTDGRLERIGGHFINVGYKILGSDYTLGSVKTLTSGAVKDGTASVGDLVISPETASDLQRAGTYGVTLTVTIGVS